MAELERTHCSHNFELDTTTKAAPSDHALPPNCQRTRDIGAAQRNKLTGDRRAGESPPAGVRLSDGLGADTAEIANCEQP